MLHAYTAAVENQDTLRSKTEVVTVFTKETAHWLSAPPRKTICYTKDTRFLRNMSLASVPTRKLTVLSSEYSLDPHTLHETVLLTNELDSHHS